MNLFPAFRLFLAKAWAVGLQPLLKFKYNGSPMPDGPPEIVPMTVTRAGDTATYVNKAGLIVNAPAHLPRWDWAEGLGCPSLLVEPQRTNLLLRSSEFDNSYWTKSNLIASGTPPWINVGVAPDGTTAAEKLIPNTSTGTGHFVVRITSESEGTYTYSCFVKQDGYRYVALSTVLAIQDWVRVTVDLQSGVVTQTAQGTSSTYTNVDSEIIELENNWYRISMTFTAASSGFSVTTAVSDTATPAIASFGIIPFVGDEVNGILCWGAQLEVGSYATSYIPTAGSTETRNADVIQLTNAADLIGQSEGTFILRMTPIASIIAVLSLNDNSSNNLVNIGQSFGNHFAIIRNAGISVLSSSSAGASIGTAFSMGVSYSLNKGVVSVNGSTITTDTSLPIFAPNTLNRIDFDNKFGAPFYGRIHQFAISKTALTAEELEEITTP